MSRTIDLMHLGQDRVIAAYDVDGVIVDPGPSTCLDTLLGALGDETPRALLLTHIHLDHAGATGLLVRRFPDLKVYVHERGAPHMVDPSKLLVSAAKLYGDDMERLWGEVAPVPEANVTVLSGGETVEGFRVAYTPGHANHHVSYLHESSGHCYTGDVGGVRIPPVDFTLPPTPPPDIDLEKWDRSLDVIEEWSPAALLPTHFGRVDGVGDHLARLREGIAKQGERSRAHGREAFIAATEEEIERAAGHERGVVESFVQAAPPDQLWQGLERYWRKRAEREAAAR